MVIIFSSLIILSIYFLVKSYVNRFAWCFAGMVCSLEVCLVLILISMMRTGNYFAYYNGITQLDYMLYNFVDTLSLPLNMIDRIFNCMMGTYMVLFPCFMYYFFSSTVKYSLKVILAFIGIVAVALLSVFFYSPDSLFTYYRIMLDQSSSVNIFLKYLIYCIDILYYLVFLSFLTVPIIYLVRKYKSMNPIKRRQSVGVVICSCLLNTFVSIIILSGMFRSVFILGPVTEFLYRVPSITFNQQLAMIVFLVLTVLIMFVVVNRLDVSRRIGFVEKLLCARNLHKVDRNYIEIFHMFKNVLFSYDILIKKSMLCGEEEREKNLKELDGKVNDYITKLNNVLNINKSVDLYEKKIDIADILDDAIRTVGPMNEELEIVKSYRPDEIFVMADKFYMVEAVTNLIKNSAESIQQSERKGRIELKAYSDFEWVVIEIIDNGVGFKIRNTRKIFKPLYTTKSRTNNWGIGLVHTNKIVKKHRGHMYAMNNKHGDGATLYIFLPRW